MKAQRQTENEKWEEWLGGDGSDVSLQAKDQSTRPRCEAAHSPLPWRAIESHQYDSLEGAAQLIETSNMDAVCVMIDTDDGDTCDTNAAYIVKACNEYPKLVEALKAAREILAPIVHKMNVRDHFSEKNTLANVIDKAIDNAEKSNG